MWNRKENEAHGHPSPPAGRDRVGNRSAVQAADPSYSAAAPEHAPRAMPTSKPSIGKTITIRGELTGNEDLTLYGRVEGRVNLNEHGLTIGPDARIDAEVTAKSVVVQGQVKGNIHGAEKIELTSEARVKGDLAAPRIVIADGAHFKGTVNMGEQAARSKPAPTRNKPEAEQTESKVSAA